MPCWPASVSTAILASPSFIAVPLTRRFWPRLPPHRSPLPQNQVRAVQQTTGAPSFRVLLRKEWRDRRIPRSRSAISQQSAAQTFFRRISPFRHASPFPPHREIAAAVPVAERAAALQLIREEIGDCTRCALHKGRNKLVFGDGAPDGAAHVCRRGAGRRRGRAGPSVRGPRRPTAQQHDRRHGTQARRGLHRQRGQVPTAGQSRPRAG